MLRQRIQRPPSGDAEVGVGGNLPARASAEPTAGRPGGARPRLAASAATAAPPRTARPALAVILSLAACTCQQPPAPTLVAVQPAEAPNDADAALTVLGANFLPSVKVDLDDPTQSGVNAAFALELVGPGGSRVALSGTALISETELRTTLLAGAAPAIYDLRLVDPRGRTAVLPGALVVFVRSCALAADGTPCDDGNLCTRVDACQSGACVGASPVACAPLDACHLAGTCDPATGSCSNPAAPDGTACDDGNACTRVDACLAGACAGSSPVACTALDACHLAGTCDPATGSCSNPAAPDGTACNDGNACTRVDACLAGACVGSSPVACAPLDACHLAGTCDPATGSCSNPAAPDGTPCPGTCPAGDTCQAGVCTAPSGGCINTAPLARLVVNPLASAVGSTITFDASASTDAEDPTSALTVQFDFEGSGTFSAPQPATQTSTHSYATPGLYQAWARVTDSGALWSYASALVLVVPPADLVLVTTALDENDPGATPSSPGGAGLSLREAVAWANAQPAPKVITFAGPMSVVMTGGQRTQALAAPGLAVVGEPGVSVDFGGYNQACFQLGAAGQRLVGLVIRGCNSTFVDLLAGSQLSQVAYCDIGQAAGALGVDAGASSPAGSPPTSLVGPGNTIAGLDTGVRLTGDDYAVIGNSIHSNVTGIDVQGGVRSQVHGNAVCGQVASRQSSGTALRVWSGTGPVTVWHNTFDGNARDGVEADGVPLDVRDNLFTGNGRYGIEAPSGDFGPGALGWNGFWNNLLGPSPAPLATGPTDVLADPLYVDRAAGDFRLLPASPAVDAGVDTGLDVNGPAAGNYNGLAPDLGAAETPYSR